MDLLEEDKEGYQKENDDMQTRAYINKSSPYQKKVDAVRYKYFNSHRKGMLKVLCVGCGVEEPIKVNATHACDLSALAERFLRSGNWKGEFKVCSCDNLPYSNKEFDLVICSEVIEHLPTKKDITKTFNEVNRVGKRWIITTPWITRAAGNTEPTHKHFLNEKEITRIVPNLDYFLERRDIFVFARGGIDAEKG